MIKPTPAVTLPLDDLLRGTIWATKRWRSRQRRSCSGGIMRRVSWAGNNPLHVTTVQGGCHNNLWHQRCHRISNPPPPPNLISIWAVFKPRELDLHMVSQISKHDSNYHLPVCTTLSRKYFNAPKNDLCAHPMALQQSICSLKPCIGECVLAYLWCIGFQDTICVLLLLGSTGKRFCNIKFNIVTKEFINKTYK
jgi:hypothetical protein